MGLTLAQFVQICWGIVWMASGRPTPHTSEQTEVRAVGAIDPEIWIHWRFFLYLNAYFVHSVFFAGSAETDVRWGGNLNSHLVASCVQNACTKNYQNLVILLRVTINNVGGVLSTFFCSFQRLFRVFCFPQVVQKQTLRDVGTCTAVWWTVVSGIFVPKIIKIW